MTLRGHLFSLNEDSVLICTSVPHEVTDDCLVGVLLWMELLEGFCLLRLDGLGFLVRLILVSLRGSLWFTLGGFKLLHGLDVDGHLHIILLLVLITFISRDRLGLSLVKILFVIGG